MKMPVLANFSDYSLIVCEKPDAARKVADALAEGHPVSTMTNGVEVLTFQRENANYVVCSAIGHLYGLSDSFSQRETYPVFDLEWYPANLVDKRSRGVQKRIASIKRLAGGAKRFINACDYDAEGETIGDNILRYACGGKEGVALRAKFSTLTKDELVSSFREAKAGSGSGLARAGRTRHVLDFLWGINLSRALSTSVNSASSGYKTISMGRVQGPTLGFVVQREVEIRTFVPSPYWSITALFEKDGVRFEAPSSKGKFLKRSDALSTQAACEGQTGLVSELSRSVFKERAPPPFNTGDLQKEAYRAFGLSPTKTLQVAERLYLDALISYPRTSSQKLPPSIGYRQIVSKLGGISVYAESSTELLKGSLSPREGEKTDYAHPAIYPTGDLPRKVLGTYEAKIFDLVVRRFLACFGEDAVRERISLKVDVRGNDFGLSGRRTLRLGWMKHYRKYSGAEDRAVPKLVKGDVLTVVRVDCEEKLDLGPLRYNQSSLLERMEKESIGTKATRAETIATLIARDYVAGEPVAATDLGISLVETMKEYCPKIVSTELTRETERRLEEIEGGRSDGSEVIEQAITILLKQIETLKVNETGVGGEIREASVQSSRSLNVIGKCPVCKVGNLLMIRSRKSGKRFVGCSNYSKGCRASAPLPQRGFIKAMAKPCAKCGWPVVYVRRGRFPWRLCVNLACEGKAGTKNAVQTLQKRS
jgi:DNA topoisomerase-1